MIAFYAWTDTLLINCVKLKCGEFADEEGDLFVLALPRVSEELTEKIRCLGIFRKVIVITPPGDRLPGILHKAVKVLSGRRYYKMFASQLNEAKGNRYSAVYTGGFWSYFLFLYRFLCIDSPDISIGIVEEGVGSYKGLPLALCCDPLSGRRSRILRLMFFKDVFCRAADAVKIMYFHMPEACLDSGGLRLGTLRAEVPEALRLSEEMAAGVDIRPYRDRRVLIFLQPESSADMKISSRIIKDTVSAFGADNILIKPHQDSLELLDKLELPDGVYVERTAFPIDHIIHLIDWNSKVIVSRSSSSAFFPKLICRCEPCAVLYYRLFPAGEMGNMIEDLSEKLKALYEEPDRVMLPRTYAELDRMLTAFKDENNIRDKVEGAEI